MSLLQQTCFLNYLETVSSFKFFGRCKWSKRDQSSSLMRMTKRMWEDRAAQTISIHLLCVSVRVCVRVCMCEYLLNECVYVRVCACLCVCARAWACLILFFYLCKSNMQRVLSDTPSSRCAVWGMPVGWLLLTWPTPRDSRSALRFSPMPRTSNKTWPSPIMECFWMAWPKKGATLTPLSRAAAS